MDIKQTISEQQALLCFAALSHPSRLAIFRAVLAQTPDSLAAGQIGEQLGIAASTLSGHLAKLRQSGLIEVTRQGTSLQYRARQTSIADFVSYITDTCCQQNPDICNLELPAPEQKAKPLPIPTPKTSERPEDKTKTAAVSVLFLCTGNSARSILAECILNRLGSKQFCGYSAGSAPVGKVNPAALALLEDHGFAVRHLASKSWDSFTGKAAPALDIVITVCGNAAGETCPIWTGAPVTAHWGLPDPAAVTGSKTKIATAFEQTYAQLQDRIYAMLELDIAQMSAAQITSALQQIGQMDGAA
ncbi:Arsenate reductase thioredoxin-coupled, LMWP family [hydrothermal vent metagenome]|uniref:Arsenate reductase thioredoxin-coupled, LMWP family n=1 Tax=hydrothermal vent metagenome TaxID=652676 RepID=A0A3B0RG26_9ZZZZ